MTITVREKGKTLNESGGLVMTTDMWMTPNAPSTRDLADFDMRYAQKLYGPMVAGASAQDMAMAMAMYPQMKPALDKMRAEGGKMLAGTAILTDMKMESVPPGTANSASATPAAAEPAPKKGLGGMLGGLKKMAEQAEKNQQQGGGKAERAIIMTTSVEMLKLTTDVDAASVAMPAGFTEKRSNLSHLLLLGGEIRHAHPEVDDAFHRGAVDFAIHLDVERRPAGVWMVKAMFRVLPLYVPFISATPCGVSIEPVTFSPSCFNVAVAVIGPSGPLIVRSHAPATLVCAYALADTVRASARIAENTRNIRCLLGNPTIARLDPAQLVQI